jgi:Tfp pilus assembly protein PilN
MRINLLPLEYRPKPLVELWRVLLITAAIVVLLASLAFLGWNYYTCNTLAERISVLEGQIAVYDPAMAELEGLEVFIAKVRQWEKEMEGIRSLYPQHQQFLWSLATALPQEVWLTKVEIEPEKKLIVKGNTMNFRAMGQLLENINGVAFFKSSAIKEIKEITSDKIIFYEFEIEIEAGGDRQ